MCLGRAERYVNKRADETACLSAGRACRRHRHRSGLHRRRLRALRWLRRISPRLRRIARTRRWMRRPPVRRWLRRIACAGGRLRRITSCLVLRRVGIRRRLGRISGAGWGVRRIARLRIRRRIRIRRWCARGLWSVCTSRRWCRRCVRSLHLVRCPGRRWRLGVGWIVRRGAHPLLKGGRGASTGKNKIGFVPSRI